MSIGGQSTTSEGGDDQGGPTPSWEYYAAAAATPMPLYRVELAKSGRSKCRASGKYQACGRSDSLIREGEVRVGQVDGLGSAIEGQAGTYTRWKHLRCWRVPNKVSV